MSADIQSNSVIITNETTPGQRVCLPRRFILNSRYRGEESVDGKTPFDSHARGNTRCPVNYRAEGLDADQACNSLVS